MVEPVPGTDDVHLVDTELFGMPGVMSVYLVDDEWTALVDAGAATAVDPVLDALASLGLEPADLDLIVPTHVHLDHAGAAGALVAACPNARVLVHERGRPYLVDRAALDRLSTSARRALGPAAEQYGEPALVPADRCEAIAGGDEVDLGDRSLAVIDAPGHAPHQVALLDDRDGVLFAADAAGMALGGELYPTTPPPDFDLEASLATLERLRAAAPSAVCYGHFGVRTDADAALSAFTDLLPAWVEAVREAAEDALAAAEPAGPADPTELVDATLEGLGPRWTMPTVERDVAGVLRYLRRADELEEPS